MQSIVEKIHEHALNRPDSIAFVIENDQLTYAELWDSVLRCYSILRNAGLKNGDRVVFQSCYTRHFVIACFATHLCHAIFVPIDKNAAPESIEITCRKLDARCVITKNPASGAEICLTFSELQDLISHAASGVSYIFPSEEEAAFIMSTTGTTGNPKSTVLSQRSLCAVSIVQKDYLSLTAQSGVLSFAPLNHVASIWILCNMIYSGGVFIMLDGILHLKQMYQYIEKYNVTSLYIPPSGISILAQNTINRLADYADHIDSVIIASSSINESLLAYLRRTLPHTNLSYQYGSTEMGHACAINLNDNKGKPISCVGKPVPGVTVRIVDDDKNDLPVGESGQIMVKSNNNFSGYWQNPELTAKVMYDGFVVSDDIGYKDQDGYIYIVGRKDDMINIGGLKVFPAEIENAAMSIDGVLDCICFRAQDPITGQAAKLLIVKKEDSALTLQEIRTQLLKSLDAYKIPRMIDFTDHIEKTANGKPNRKAYQ